VVVFDAFWNITKEAEDKIKSKTPTISIDAEDYLSNFGLLNSIYAPN